VRQGGIGGGGGHGGLIQHLAQIIAQRGDAFGAAQFQAGDAMCH
jgi:hypothetical protein